MANFTERELIESATGKKTEGSPSSAIWSSKAKAPLSKIHDKYLKITRELENMSMEARNDARDLLRIAKKIEDPGIKGAYEHVADLLNKASVSMNQWSMDPKGPNQVQYNARSAFDISY